MKGTNTIPSKIKNYLTTTPNQETPTLIFDLGILTKKYKDYKKNFPNIDVYYAVKANPAPQILKTLDKLGSCFDVASIEEVDMCLNVGISPEKISWGSTIKKARLIKEAYNKGIRLYAFDSEEELHKIAENAPESKVFCRILVNNSNALWPLAAKFGCSTEMAEELLVKAQELGLDSYGISFHVGSQQIDLDAWDAAISLSAKVYFNLKDNHNIKLKMLNIGGGYPAYGYLTSYRSIRHYKQHIYDSLKQHFFDEEIELIAEPGRFLVADAGIIISEVILVSKKYQEDEERWVYLDVGLFGGLAETMGESIKYKILTNKDTDKNLGKVNLAGPTCDGTDILYKEFKQKMPMSLKSGDYVYILSTGAYTSTYSSIGFNGFKPLKELYLD